MCDRSFVPEKACGGEGGFGKLVVLGFAVRHSREKQETML